MYISQFKNKLFFFFPYEPGAHLKKIAPSRGRREHFWVISCEKSRFYAQKNQICSKCRGKRENFWGISCEKSRFYAKKS
jgi:hypothetical protein